MHSIQFAQLGFEAGIRRNTIIEGDFFMHRHDLESNQVHYIPKMTMAEYKKSYDYRIMKKLIDLCGKGNKVLEVGCGSGFVSRLIKDNGNEVTGVDIQDSALREARKKGLKVVKARAQALPFKDASFDVVAMPGMIEHFLETQDALAEAKRVLRPGGKLIVATPNFTSFRDRVLVIFGHMPAYSMHHDHVKFFNRRRLSQEIRKAGFRLIKTYGSGLGIPIPKMARIFFFADRVLPSSLLEALIAYTEKRG